LFINFFLLLIRPFYEGYFGGVSVVNKEHYLKANGFSNVYFGWGAEDDDFRMRIISNKYKIIKPKEPLGRYYMHKHKQDKANPNRGKLLKYASKRYKTDGLNTAQYELIDIEKHSLYTKFIVYYNETKIYLDNKIKLVNGNVTFI
jgi:beta-1,4-galactosyltransferase 1